MDGFRIGLIGIVLLAMFGCGKSDVSGVYVSGSDRRVTLIQLIQGPDGNLSGRVQETTVSVDGKISDKSGNLDGSVSGDEILLRPESAWYGGLQASGSMSGGELTLVGEGFTFTAERSSFEKYQDAVARLRSLAADERSRIQSEQAELARAAAKVKEAEESTNRVAAITGAAIQISASAERIRTGVERSPNFGRLASVNTARLELMLQRAARLPAVDPSQLSAAANQITEDTDQIEAARAQYATRLNQVIQDLSPALAEVQRSCAPPPASKFASQCRDAMSAVTRLQAAVQHGHATFSPYERQVRAEVDRQSALIERIDN